MINENDIKSLLPLTGAAFRILMALSDKILHGYGIMKESADEQGSANSYRYTIPNNYKVN
jgi:hypothetical protein